MPKEIQRHPTYNQQRLNLLIIQSHLKSIPIQIPSNPIISHYLSNYSSPNLLQFPLLINPIFLLPIPPPFKLPLSLLQSTNPLNNLPPTPLTNPLHKLTSMIFPFLDNFVSTSSTKGTCLAAETGLFPGT